GNHRQGEMLHIAAIGIGHCATSVSTISAAGVESDCADIPPAKAAIAVLIAMIAPTSGVTCLQAGMSLSINHP
ncbi:MAG: hypothetical protein NXI03_10330, partial [Alphaproteobacteria bacterium]|nr:hypothetical protein [Alphaproteobacteria bacterium]